jgi:hypothetical protein
MSGLRILRGDCYQIRLGVQVDWVDGLDLLEQFPEAFLLGNNFA